MTKKKHLLYSIIIIFIFIHFQFFLNTYITVKNNYDYRMISNYGFCEKTSYGFVKYINEKYNLKQNIHIYNYEDYPYSAAFIYKPKKNYLDTHIIVLNYDDRKTKINLKNFLLIEKIKNCMFLKKK